MTRTERFLRLFLRLFAVVCGLPALFCVVVPYSWMNAIHQSLGMGELPDEPIVGYLTRSASALYALLLWSLWIIACDLRRHRLLLFYFGAASIVFGVLLLGIDLGEEMPLLWSLGEGPATVVLGIFILLVTCRVGEYQSDPGPEEQAGRGFSG